MSLLATWAGDEAAFAALQTPLLSNLKKTKARAKHDSSLNLAIPLKFIRYSKLKADKSKKLLNQPILHVYVVAVESGNIFKTSHIRENLINWYRVLQHDYRDYNYKQQAIVITVLGDIPRQSQNHKLRNLDEISVENLETLSNYSDSSETGKGDSLNSSSSAAGSDLKTNSNETSLTISSSASNLQPTSRYTFSKQQSVAEIVMKDLSALTLEYEYPNSCYITTLHEPLRTTPKSTDSWNKLCVDMGYKFSLQFYTMVQNHQNLIEDLRIENENLSYFEYFSTQEHLALAYCYTECYMDSKSIYRLDLNFLRV